MDDHALLRAYLDEGSEAAFAQLVERYLPLVHNAAVRRMNGDESRAREVTQLVFSELVQKAVKLARHPVLAAWLHQSTRWHAANLRRAERRRRRHEAAAAEHILLTNTPEAEPTWDSLRPVLDAALDSLRPADRDAVLQRYFLDQPFAAISRQLGLSENAARMRVDRALETLRQALARYGVTSSGAALALVLAQHTRAAVPPDLTAGVIASTACKASAAGTAAVGGATLFMTKSALGVVGVCAAALSAMLWHQEETNRELAREIMARESALHEAAKFTPRPPPEPTTPALSPQALRDLEDDILAAAELAVPLTAEQQERVRLDTIVRKGELDFEYGMLFRQLNLPPATLDALKTLLVERNQAIYDARQLAKEEGLVFASLVEAKTVENSALGDIDARIAGLLGGDGYTKLREHGSRFLPPHRRGGATGRDITDGPPPRRAGARAGASPPPSGPGLRGDDFSTGGLAR
ncbi:MAG TPA: sigma-70 family RNA polymerase sigma factor [Candidatus Synoicihabitans sp.]|nr:sigma-70 family RNA polymerase sigma factor [Candidatus Synoicihabitans sp.]